MRQRHARYARRREGAMRAAMLRALRHGMTARAYVYAADAASDVLPRYAVADVRCRRHADAADMTALCLRYADTILRHAFTLLSRVTPMRAIISLSVTRDAASATL